MLRRSLTAAVAAALALPLLAGAEPPQQASCDPQAGTIQVAPPVPPATATKTDGTANGDVIFGSPGNDAIGGLGGNDCIDGRGGTDELEGGDGDDVLVLGDPAALIPVARGGAGDDRLVGSGGNDSLDGGPGADAVQAGEGDDRLVDDSEDSAYATDTLDAGPGNDTLLSVGGEDALDAGDGDDEITARNGDRDTIVCGPGTDSAQVDLDDVVTDCETVSRPSNRVRSVSPRSGGVRTRFLVRFRGVIRNDLSNDNRFTLGVIGPEGTPCRRSRPANAWDSDDIKLGRAIRSARMRAPGTSRRWCRGTYRGELIESISNPSSSCEEDDAPPSCSGERVIGTFTFRVR